MIETQCLQCDKRFWIKPYMPSIGEGKYCSKERRGLSQRQSINNVLLNIVLYEPSTLDTGCWGYLNKSEKNDYVKVTLNRKIYLLHRLVYEHFAGLISDDKECHHKCRNKWCCNFEHIEVEPSLKHNHEEGHISYIHSQKTHCPKDHPYDEENTYWRNGKRHCRECRRAANRAWYRKTHA